MAVDVSNAAKDIMLAHYKRKYGSWTYRVAPTCRRLYACEAPGNVVCTDGSLFEALSNRGIEHIVSFLQVVVASSSVKFTR